MSSYTIHLADCFDVFREIPDGSVDLILTDPPYGCFSNDDCMSARWISKGGTQKEKRPIIGDGPEADETARRLFHEAARVLKPGCCCCCCCGGGGHDPILARWCLALGEVLKFKQIVVWDKGKMGVGAHYRSSYETIIVAQKKGAPCRWFDNTHMVENIIRPGDYGIKKIIPSKTQHPTVKPVALMAHFIRLHTMSGDVVLDPFMGSGTTGVACVNMDREFIGVELDPQFYEMAEKRLKNAEANNQKQLEFAMS